MKKNTVGTIEKIWYSFNTHIPGTVSTHTFQVQFQHTHFKYSFNTHITHNTHISGTVSTHTFQVQFQHTHFKYSFNTHISMQFNTHISSTNFNKHIMIFQLFNTKNPKKIQIQVPGLFQLFFGEIYRDVLMQPCPIAEFA